MEDLLVVLFTIRKHDFHIIYLNSQDISIYMYFWVRRNSSKYWRKIWKRAAQRSLWGCLSFLGFEPQYWGLMQEGIPWAYTAQDFWYHQTPYPSQDKPSNNYTQTLGLAISRGWLSGTKPNFSPKIHLYGKSYNVYPVPSAPLKSVKYFLQTGLLR